MAPKAEAAGHQHLGGGGQHPAGEAEQHHLHHPERAAGPFPRDHRHPEPETSHQGDTPKKHRWSGTILSVPITGRVRIACTMRRVKASASGSRDSHP